MVNLGKMGKLVMTLIIVVILAALVWMMSSKEDQRIIQPSNDSKSNQMDISKVPGVTNVQRFSDAEKIAIKNAANRSNRSLRTGTSSGTKTPMPTKTPKPLPYPRVTINYSVEKTSSVRSNNVNDSRNNTFVIVKLDIRNYGYKYFDAYPGRFRMGRNADIIPLVNITTGNMINAVIVNNSRAKGDLLFSLSKKTNIGILTYLSADKSVSYYILYKKVSSSEMDDVKKQEVTDDEDV